MDFGSYVFASPYFGWLCNGVLMTLLISMISGICSALIGFLVVRCRMSSHPPLRWGGKAFISVFRNLPLVPLLLCLTFGIPRLWREFWGHAFPQGLELHLLLLGLALNTAAYFGEILYAGITAVAPQQAYAARTLGLPLSAIRRHVIYPQAVRI